MRRLFLCLSVFIALLLLGGCASNPEYSQNFSPTTDFSQFKTWKWADNRPVLADNLLGEDPMERLVRKTITAEMEARGMKLVLENPDLLVSYLGNIFQAISSSPEKSGYSNQVSFLQSDSGNWFRRSSREGVLSISLLDPKTRLPVWSGTGREPVADEGEVIRKIPNVVRTILASYPPVRR